MSLNKIIPTLFIIFAIGITSCYKSPVKKDYAIVIHGGAGNIDTTKMDKKLITEYKNHLRKALSIGENILKNGGTSTEAVCKTVNYLEDCPMFNAGKGSVFTHDGKNELDASIMDGKTMNAGAVAGVTDIKNPINAALKVMTNSKHVMLSGKGASEFAASQNIKIVSPEYFFTEKKWKALQRQLKKNKVNKHGTVGCVALDKEGNICAGTSTGGMSNKRYGRIGDSPVIGAGTYANNNTCGISCTGHGEYFIRYAVAHDISALIEYKCISIEEAAKEVVMNKLKKAKGNGGIIGLDKYGNEALVFNTKGMFRGYANSDGVFKVAL